VVAVRRSFEVGPVRRAVMVPAAMGAGTLLVVAAVPRAGGAGAVAWVVGVPCAAGIGAAVVRGLVRTGHTLGPPDLVTLGRAVLTCALAALVADTFLGRPAGAALVALSVLALALDAADGWVARRTGTASAFGARMDGEVDAFLILVLSVHVAGQLGGWVVTLGAARYAFWAAGRALPWMRERLPFRYWRKVVTATQGIVLTVVAAGVFPALAGYAAVAVALALLAESFGRDVLWLWRRRSPDRERLADSADPSRVPRP